MASTIICPSCGYHCLAGDKPAGRLFCKCGYVVIITPVTEVLPPPAAYVHPGNKAWALLHEYVWTSEADAISWLTLVWEPQIPKYGCDCEPQYQEYKATNPPTADCAENFRQWGFRLHNWVNNKIGKEPLTIEAASEKWGW